MSGRSRRRTGAGRADWQQPVKACGVGKEVFGVLEPFNIRMICYGASSHNLCFLVPGDDAEKVVQKLHQNLFE